MRVLVYRERVFLVLVAVLFLMRAVPARAQFCDSSTGLLQMPTADMQDDGTFMITNNFLNKNALPSSGWCYNTFQYGFYVSFWGRMEIGYVCTLFNDYWKGEQTRKGVWMINQDRHFTGRIRLLKEGEFGLKWIPSLVVGASDPFTGANASDDYTNLDGVSGTANGYFNRLFIVMTKHFNTSWGQIGAHAGYQKNRRTDYSINGLCAGVDWKPVWIQNKGFLDNMSVILEYDSRTVNMGFIASIWDNRFEAMFELQNFQWVNFGLRYKLRLKKAK